MHIRNLIISYPCTIFSFLIFTSSICSLFLVHYVHANSNTTQNTDGCTCKVNSCPPSTTTSCINNQCPLKRYQIITKCEKSVSDFCTRISGCGKDCVPSDCVTPRPCKELTYCGCEKKKITVVWGCNNNGECVYDYVVVP